MTNIDVSDIKEYQEAIDAIRKDYGVCWFRGLTDKKYVLEPSIYRKPYKPELEATFLGQFKSQAPPFLQKLPINDWEWLFLMQHYGVPTRLMDWTAHPLVALTFTLKNLEKAADDNKDLVVYCLNPEKLNKRITAIDFDENNPIPFIGDDQQYLFGVGQNKSNNLPIAIIGPLNNDRIIVQKGTFTLFPFKLDKKIEEYEHADEFLKSITLKTGRLFEMKQSLENLGFTYDSLFPGLDSIAKSIVKPFKK